MRKKIRKGMILGAGLGTRLQPITGEYPKPIVPVLNVANLLHSIDLLERSGVEEIVINLFHLPEQIESFLKNTPGIRAKVSYSREETLLGTGGGLKKAESFFQREPFLLVNCDFISNVNLAHFIDRHFARNALATMILFTDAERQALYSKVGVTANGHLCSLPSCSTEKSARSGIFTGIHILDPEVFRWLRVEPSGINEVLYPELMRNHGEAVFAEFLQDEYWYDTGDVPALCFASQHLLEAAATGEAALHSLWDRFGGAYREIAPKIFAHHSHPLQRTGAPPNWLGPALIGRGATIDPSATIGPYSVVGERVHVAAGAVLNGTIALAGSRVPEGRHEAGIFYKDGLLPAKRPA